MSDRRDDDDEALAWAGDDDPTLAPITGAPAVADRRVADRRGAEPTPARRTVLDDAEDAEDRAAERELADAEAAGAQLSSVALIGFGVLGGVYLLFTIGWIISFTRYEVPIDVDFTVLSHRIGQALAVAASPLWFVSVLLVGQRADIRYRFLWLVVGVLVLVPWPFLLGV